jgi:hypothetical protein
MSLFKSSSQPVPQILTSRTILELLAETLKVPAENDDEARKRLATLVNSFPKRPREVVSYLLSGPIGEVFLERRGGGSSLWYLLWWLRTHARENYEKAALAALHSALSGGWPLEKAYDPLLSIKEVQPYLPPPAEKKKGDFQSSGVYFYTDNNLTIAVNSQPKDLFSFALKQGAQAYIWVTDTHFEMRVDGRSGLGFPELSPEWVIVRNNRRGLPTYCRLSRRVTKEEMDQILDYMWQKLDRRWKDSLIPASLGGSQKRYKA